MTAVFQAQTQVAAVANELHYRAVMLQLLKYNLEQARNRMKQYADKHRTKRTFQIRDWVYLWLQLYCQSSLALRRNLILAPQFYGPYQVLEKFGEVAYKLLLPPTSKIHPVFHVSILKRKVG